MPMLRDLPTAIGNHYYNSSSGALVIPFAWSRVEIDLRLEFAAPAGAKLDQPVRRSVPSPRLIPILMRPALSFSGAACCFGG